MPKQISKTGEVVKSDQSDMTTVNRTRTVSATNNSRSAAQVAASSLTGTQQTTKPV